MTRKNQHIVQRDNGWAVRGAGNSRDTAIYPTQRQAIERGEKIARNNGTDTKIHGVDGKIRAGNSYGNDPFPPKDRN